MANSSPADIVVSYDGDNITAHVQTINDVDVEQILEEVRALGDAWDAYLSVGIGKMAPIELGGIYSDVADGPDDQFAGRVPEAVATAAKVLIITWAAGKTTTVSTHLVKYVRKVDKNALTRWTATLQPTGAVVEA